MMFSLCKGNSASRYSGRLAAVLGIFLSSNGIAAFSGATCKAFGTRDRTRLLAYVQKKYKLPAAAKLQLSEESFVGATCYRKLNFKSDDSKRPFHVALFLSPDFRFLTPELLDSTLDPVLEERRREQALIKGVTAGNHPSRGAKDAPVTITIFSDFQCPYCARMAAMLTRDILRSERKTTRLVFRHFPLNEHLWALPAAQAAACAQEQNETYFWRLHDFLFDRQRELSAENVLLRVTDETNTYSGFNQQRFANCLTSKETLPQIEEDIAFGNESGVSATPTLFINGRQAGAVAAPEHLRTLIREALSTPRKALVSSRGAQAPSP